MAAKGKRLSALHFGGIWHNPTGCSGYCEFDQVGFDAVAAHGVFPLYSWGSDSADDSYDAQFRNAAVASGAQDEYIKRWATSAKAYGKKILLCPNWEFNGNWFNWGPQSTTAAGTNTDFVNSWRRIHNIFKEVGANNVLFGWVPNIDPDGWWAKTSGYSLESMFPGNDYVDAVGLDGYNPGDAQWQSFSQLFGSTYATLRRLAPKKPVFINEVGCTESGGSKAKWIKDMFKVLLILLPLRFLFRFVVIHFLTIHSSFPVVFSLKPHILFHRIFLPSSPRSRSSRGTIAPTLVLTTTPTGFSSPPRPLSRLSPRESATSVTPLRGSRSVSRMHAFVSVTQYRISNRFSSPMSMDAS